MKKIIQVGRPTHFRRVANAGTGAVNLPTHCGLTGSTFAAAYDPRDVDCLNCMKTKAYRATMRTGP